MTYLIYVLLGLETFKAIKRRPLLVEIPNFKVLNACLARSQFKETMNDGDGDGDGDGDDDDDGDGDDDDDDDDGGLSGICNCPHLPPREFAAPGRGRKMVRLRQIYQPESAPDASLDAASGAAWAWLEASTAGAFPQTNTDRESSTRGLVRYRTIQLPHGNSTKVFPGLHS